MDAADNVNTATNTTKVPEADVETSMDLENTVDELQKANKTETIRRHSVFEISMLASQARDNQEPSIELKSYKEKLHREIEDWQKVYKKALSDLKTAKTKLPVLDCSKLSSEKRDFLEKAPDFSRFLRQMKEFRCAGRHFMENDYEEVLLIHENLMLFIKHGINVRKRALMERQFANFYSFN